MNRPWIPKTKQNNVGWQVYSGFVGFLPTMNIVYRKGY